MQVLSAVRVAFIGTLTLALAGSALAQTTWHVDVNAAPPGQGTPSSPYASIQYAIDQPTTVAGDTVLVAPGTYFEALLVLKSITIRSSGGPLSTILRPSSGDDGVELYGVAGNTVFEGFTVTANTGWSGIYLFGATARRCIVSGCTSIAGIESIDGRIESSTIAGNSGHGVIGQAGGGGSIVISNSITWGNPWGDFAPNGGFVDAKFNAGLGLAGNGNIPGDPWLWELASGDVHLRPGSPCIDAGDPASPLDPDGTRIDIGALVFEPTYAPAPVSYCAGKLNSQGCVPSISSTGAASATSSGPFTIAAALEPDNKPGLLLLGFAKSTQPFQGGTLCIAPPIKRAGAQLSGGAGPCTGAFAFDMQAFIQSGVPGFVPGALVAGQWWNRDPLDPAGFGSGLSNAIWFGIAP